MVEKNNYFPIILSIGQYYKSKWEKRTGLLLLEQSRLE
jgi:hypothetical protein